MSRSPQPWPQSLRKLLPRHERNRSDAVGSCRSIVPCSASRAHDPPPISADAARADVHNGLVDAVSYLGIGHVFTANMTGNIVFLGFGIAGSGGLPVVAPLVSLGSFLVGAGAGGVLAARMGERHPNHMARALCIEVGLIGFAAVLAAA